MKPRARLQEEVPRSFCAGSKQISRGGALVPLGINIKASGKEITSIILQTEHPVFLRKLGGIHIAAAPKLGSPELVTVDKKMADAANLLGINIKLLKKSIPSNESPQRFLSNQALIEEALGSESREEERMNDFKNETSAFVLLRGKFHRSSPQSDEMAGFTFLLIYCCYLN